MAKKQKTTDSNVPKDKFLEEVENTNEGSSAPVMENLAGESSQPTTPKDEMQSENQESAVPNETPPMESLSANDGGFGAAVWHDNKNITGLWSKNETRNSWAAVSGMGWKKLNSANDSSCAALTILSSHACAFSKKVKLKLENDQIKEMYVW